MYDYIIVGAGSAGCVLANRLSENKHTSVLLLEAGGPDTRQEIQIPIAFSQLFKTPLDWTYYTEPQPYLDQRTIYWPRGKVVGGSSAINAMIYVRGHPSDYDQWAGLGNRGWSYADVLPYFIRSETFEPGEAEKHGSNGPLNVTNLIEINPLTRAFLAACRACRLPLTDDFNGSRQEGIGLYHVTQKNGRRHSSAAAYLHPVRHRPNLTVMLHTHVTNICIESASGKQATGVTVLQDNQTRYIAARREIILCGGAVNSPQLLMLSGIGPAEHLQAFDIPVLVDSPGVGQNLQDHLIVAVVYTATKAISLFKAQKPWHVIRYLAFRRGPLTSNVAEAGGFIRTEPALAAPDLQFHFGPVHVEDHGLRMIGHGYSIGPTLIRPKSRGWLRLRSNNPLDAPRIDPNYGSDPRDIETLITGIKMSRKIAQAAPFDSYRGHESSPGPSIQNDQALEAFVRGHAETIYHPVGTCKMGVDELAVVDPQLRVRGITGLRVVDASVMPTIIGGNTHAPVVMIAEKAADLIRQT